jgi:hypothetical protein
VAWVAKPAWDGLQAGKFAQSGSFFWQLLIRRRKRAGTVPPAFGTEVCLIQFIAALASHATMCAASPI